LTDNVANNIFVVGFNRHYQNDNYDVAMDFFRLSREFATEPQMDARSAFFSGYIYYTRAQSVNAQNAAQASEVLPVFQQALAYFNESAPFTDTQQNINLSELVNTTNQAIEWAEGVSARQVTAVVTCLNAAVDAELIDRNPLWGLGPKRKSRGRAGQRRARSATRASPNCRTCSARG
jgi:hypothetical protein